MSDFPVLTPSGAPEASRPMLEAAEARFGFVPNLLGVLAAAPAALASYMSVGEAVEQSSLTPVEQQVVYLATPEENRCEYCVAAHSAVAAMAGVPDEAREALRAGRDPVDPRLRALSRFARAVVSERGWVDPEGVAAFRAAGFTRAQILEVIAIVAQKTLSNYVNHIATTPLGGAFAPHRWEAPEPLAAR